MAAGPQTAAAIPLAGAVPVPVSSMLPAIANPKPARENGATDADKSAGPRVKRVRFEEKEAVAMDRVVEHSVRHWPSEEAVLKTAIDGVVSHVRIQACALCCACMQVCRAWRRCCAGCVSSSQVASTTMLATHATFGWQAADIQRPGHELDVVTSMPVCSSAHNNQSLAVRRMTRSARSGG